MGQSNVASRWVRQSPALPDSIRDHTVLVGGQRHNQNAGHGRERFGGRRPPDVKAAARVAMYLLMRGTESAFGFADGMAWQGFDQTRNALCPAAFPLRDEVFPEQAPEANSADEQDEDGSLENEHMRRGSLRVVPCPQDVRFLPERSGGAGEASITSADLDLRVGHPFAHVRFDLEAKPLAYFQHPHVFGKDTSHHAHHFLYLGDFEDSTQQDGPQT
jgi:hypothetical protein